MSQLYKAAVHLFFMQDNQLLLLRRANTGYRDGYYSVVAGHLEVGESVVQAAIREAHEEAGVVIQPDKVDVVQVMHRKSDDERIDFFVRIHAWEGEIYNAEPHKCDHLGWFPQDNLPEKIVPYVRLSIENYANAQWFDSFGY